MKEDLKNSKFNRYRVTYQFHSSKFGFQNSITVISLTEDMARDNAMNEISLCYGSKMAKRFSIVRAEILK